MAILASRSATITLSLVLAHLIQAQTCYYPDRTAEPNFIPCNVSASYSLCCQIGASCLTTSLCFSQWDTSFNTGTCTDKTWTDPSCFQQCPQALSADHGLQTLYRCDNNEWCCSMGGNTTSCCDDGGVTLFQLNKNDVSQVMGGTAFADGLTIGAVDLFQTSTSIAASSATSAPVAVSTSSRASTSGNATNAEGTHTGSTSGGNDATGVGLGAGLGVGLPLLAGLAVALFFFRRMRSKGKSQMMQSEEKTASVGTHFNRLAHQGQRVRELETLPSEMPNSRREVTQELGM